MKPPSKGFFYNRSWNQWVGCRRIAPGCEHCYAVGNPAVKRSFRQIDGNSSYRVRVSTQRDDLLAGWNREAKRQNKTVTIYNSYSDVFDPEVPTDYFMALLGNIETTPYLTWLLGTKWIHKANERLTLATDHGSRFAARWLSGEPPENVWVGTSCSTQIEVDRYLHVLRGFPAFNKYIELMPLLEQIDLDLFFLASPWCRSANNKTVVGGVNWVVLGGESGLPHYRVRPCSLDWVLKIRNACKAAMVPLFINNLGGSVIWPGGIKRKPLCPGGRDLDEFPSFARTRELPSFVYPRDPSLRNPTDKRWVSVKHDGGRLIEVLRKTK